MLLFLCDYTLLESHEHTSSGYVFMDSLKSYVQILECYVPKDYWRALCVHYKTMWIHKRLIGMWAH